MLSRIRSRHWLHGWLLVHITLSYGLMLLAIIPVAAAMVSVAASRCLGQSHSHGSRQGKVVGYKTAVPNLIGE